MWNVVKEWWNRDKIRQQRMMEELERYSQALTEAREAEARVKQELEQAKDEVGIYRLKEETDRLKREGKEPWVEIKSADHSEVKGIQIELDWNDAFIQYLKDNGITGRDEETVVQKWIAFLYQDLIDRLEKKAIDNSDKPRVNDFE